MFKLLRFLALYDLFNDKKVGFTSTGNIKGEFLPKYFYTVTLYGVNLTLFFNINYGNSCISYVFILIVI